VSARGRRRITARANESESSARGPSEAAPEARVDAAAHVVRAVADARFDAAARIEPGARDASGASSSLRDRETARAAWREARSFADLCRLGEAFVAGECAFFPGWGWHELDSESSDIARELGAFHRAGFLTVASQTGGTSIDANARHIEQRAFVCGFADERAARALRALCTRPDLSIALFRRGEVGGSNTPVSLHGGVAAAFAGTSAFEEELECFAEHVSADALAELERATYVSAFDREWGRDHELWTALAQVLGAA
jgi:hypothetical protein